MLEGVKFVHFPQKVLIQGSTQILDHGHSDASYHRKWTLEMLCYIYSLSVCLHVCMFYVSGPMILSIVF